MSALDAVIIEIECDVVKEFDGKYVVYAQPLPKSIPPSWRLPAVSGTPGRDCRAAVPGREIGAPGAKQWVLPDAEQGRQPSHAKDRQVLLGLTIQGGLRLD